MTVKTEHLFDLELNVNTADKFDVGQLALGSRVVVPVSGGHFSGPAMEGVVLPGGADWVLVEPDGSFRIDVRLNLQTSAQQNIYMNYQGLFSASTDVLARYYAGELLDESEYYLRTCVRFETSSEELAWLNRRVCVASGRQTKCGVIYSVHQLL